MRFKVDFNIYHAQNRYAIYARRARLFGGYAWEFVEGFPTLEEALKRKDEMLGANLPYVFEA